EPARDAGDAARESGGVVNALRDLERLLRRRGRLLGDSTVRPEPDAPAVGGRAHRLRANYVRRLGRAAVEAPAADRDVDGIESRRHDGDDVRTLGGTDVVHARDAAERVQPRG